MSVCRGVNWVGRLLLCLSVLALRSTPGQASVDPAMDVGIDKVADPHLPRDARLVDQAGRPVRLGDYFGGPPLLFAAVQYNCPNLCGIVLDGLFGALAGSGLIAGRDYQMVAMSIDQREGPAVASRRLSGLAGRWAIDEKAVHFLTGSASVIARVSHDMGIRDAWDAEHWQFAHVSAIAITTPDGRLARWLSDVEFDPRALRSGLRDAGRGKVGRLRAQVLLLCYGFAPIHGRYGWVVRDLLDLCGAATVGGLAFYLWRSVRSERRGA